MTVAVHDETGQRLDARIIANEVALRDFEGLPADYILPTPWGDQIEAELGLTLDAAFGKLKYVDDRLSTLKVEWGLGQAPEPEEPAAPPVANQVYDEETGWQEKTLEITAAGGWCAPTHYLDTQGGVLFNPEWLDTSLPGAMEPHSGILPPAEENEREIGGWTPEPRRISRWQRFKHAVTEGARRFWEERM